MNTRPALYRSTLITAALAIGCLGAAAAQAHDDGWHGRGWHGEAHHWHHARAGYVAPGWYPGPVAYVPPPVTYVPAPVAYYPPPPVAVVPGGVSLVVRLPL